MTLNSEQKHIGPSCQNYGHILVKTVAAFPSLQLFCLPKSSVVVDEHQTLQDHHNYRLNNMTGNETNKPARIAIRVVRGRKTKSESSQKILDEPPQSPSFSTNSTCLTSTESLLEEPTTPNRELQAKRRGSNGKVIRSIKQVLQRRSSSEIDSTATPKSRKTKIRMTSAAAEAMLEGRPTTPRSITQQRRGSNGGSMVSSLKERFCRTPTNKDKGDLNQEAQNKTVNKIGFGDVRPEILLPDLSVEAPYTPRRKMSRRGSNESIVSSIKEKFRRTPRRDTNDDSEAVMKKIELADISTQAIILDLPLEVPSTPIQKMKRRGSNGSVVSNIKEALCITPRRNSLTNGSSTPTRSSTRTPNTQRRSSLTSGFNTSFGNLLGNMSFCNIKAGKRAPIGKEVFLYAESSNGELSSDDGFDDEFEFDQEGVSMGEAEMLLRHVEDQIQQQNSQKQNIAKACHKDWELACARREAGNQLGFSVLVRRMYYQQIECLKHEEILKYLETLKLIIQTEINHASSMAELTDFEPALAMPITTEALQEEIEFMLCDWESNISRHEINVEEMDDIPDNEQEFHRKLLSIESNQP